METTYKPSDLKWVKNVKRSGGTDWAYMEQNVGDYFYLNWSKKFKGNVLKPRTGDVILLFQTIKEGLGSPAGTYLTHLVTPLENKIVIDKNSSHSFTRLVGVIAKASPPIFSRSKDLNLYKPNRGACCDINLVESFSKTVSLPIEKKQNKIWCLFKSDENMQGLFNFIAETGDEDEGVLEGRERAKLRIHKYYERNPDIVRRAKNKAIKENRLKCEVCDFDFEISYPILGREFIECHHKIPIATGVERITRVENLALVCSNCHRMLHRKLENRYLTIEELKAISTIIK